MYDLADDAEERRELIDLLVSTRMKLGLSQEELAARMGIKQGTVSSFEQGNDPRISTFFRYARALGFSPTIEMNDA